MTVKFSPWGNSQFVDSTGAPAVGWKIYTYVAGSSTLATTYTTSAGNVAQSNPIVLNSLGLPTTGQIWLTEGVSYKLVLTNAADVVQKTEDSLTGVNDSDASLDEWVAGPAPTYISATQFSLVGDQTSTFQVGRRVKTTNSGGTIYSTITVSAFAAVTTVTVLNDSGTLDSGLSAVSYGLLSATNPSTPAFIRGASSNAAAPSDALFTRGGQIGFPATQIPSTDANTLDDYEESNAWTPTLTFATPGDLSVTYSTRAGTYTKVGRLVTLSGSIVTSAFTHTTASGVLRVTGSPFTAENISGANWTTGSIWRGITKANYSQVNATATANSAIITFDICGSGQASTNVAASDMPTGGTVVIIFTLTFEASA